MKKITLIISFLLVITVQPVLGAYTGNPELQGTKYIKWQAIADTAGRIAVVTPDGELKTTATVSGDVNLDTTSLRVEDDDGDVWNITSNESGEVHITGEDVNLATDTGLQNIVSISNTILDQLQDTGVSRDWQLAKSSDSVTIFAGENIPVTLQNQDTGVVVEDLPAVDRAWNMDATTDSVTVEGQVAITNQDTDVDVVTLPPVTLANQDTGVIVEEYQGSTLPVQVTNQIPGDTDVLIRGETSAGTEVVLLTNTAGELIIQAKQNGVWSTARSWDLNAGSDSVSIFTSDGNKITINDTGELQTSTTLEGDVNLDTASLRVEDDEGDIWNIRSDESGVVYITGSETLPVEVTNQTTFDTEGIATESTLRDVRNDTSRTVTNTVDVQKNLLDATSDSVQIFTFDSQGNLQPLRSTPGGELKVVSSTEDTFLVTVNDYTGSTIPVEVANQTTFDTSGLATESSLISRLERTVFAGETFPVEVTNQVESTTDTDVYVTNPSLLVDQSDTARTVSGTVTVKNQPSSDTDVNLYSVGGETVTARNNALRIFAISPQRSIFDESTGETATVSNNGLHVSIQNQSQNDSPILTEVTNQTAQDTDVYVTNTSLTVDQSDTSRDVEGTVSVDNQDTTVQLSDTNVIAHEPVLSESGGTGVSLTAGDTYEVNFGSPVANAFVQVSSETGEITITDGQADADQWDISLFPQSGYEFEQTNPQYVNIYCVEDATVKWRYESTTP